MEPSERQRPSPAIHSAFPQRADLACREEAAPVAAKEPSVQEPSLVGLAPLLQDDLVHRCTVVLIVEVELPAPAPG
jgi:hypothetical protein